MKEPLISLDCPTEPSSELFLTFEEYLIYVRYKLNLAKSKKVHRSVSEENFKDNKDRAFLEGMIYAYETLEANLCKTLRETQQQYLQKRKDFHDS